MTKSNLWFQLLKFKHKLYFVCFILFWIKCFMVSTVLRSKVLGRVFVLFFFTKKVRVNEHQVYSRNDYFTPTVSWRVIKTGHVTVQMCAEDEMSLFFKMFQIFFKVNLTANDKNSPSLWKLSKVVTLLEFVNSILVQTSDATFVMCAVFRPDYSHQILRHEFNRVFKKNIDIYVILSNTKVDVKSFIHFLLYGHILT